MPDAIIIRAAARLTRNAPRASTSWSRSHSSTGVSTSALEVAKPALFTTRSTPPKRSAASANAWSTADSPLTSTVTASARSVPSDDVTFSARSPSMSATTTQAPSVQPLRDRSADTGAGPGDEHDPSREWRRRGSERQLALFQSQYSTPNFSASEIGEYDETDSAPRITLIAFTKNSPATLAPCASVP